MIHSYLRMLLFGSVILPFFVNAQLDSFSLDYDHETYGVLEFEMYKYSIRGDDFQVHLHDGTSLTEYTTPLPIRTYRGVIKNMPNTRVCAVWYSSDKIFFKVFFGKGDRGGFEIRGVKTSQFPPVPLNLPIYTSTPQRSVFHLSSGYSSIYNEFVNKAQEDISTFVAAMEHGVNIQDHASVRDIGLSWDLTVVVVPVDASINSNTIYLPDASDGIPEIPVWWRSYGAGGGAGKKDYCENYQGGRTSWGKAGFGSLHHEFGHTLGLDHYHNQRDGMHSNQNYFGRDNVKSCIDYLVRDNCAYNPDTPDYTDPLHPQILQDYKVVEVDETVTISVLDNDVDYNGDVISILNYDSVSAKGGQIIQQGNNLVYTPPSGFKGQDSFYYVAQSGVQGTGSATDTYFVNEAKVLLEVREEGLALHYTFDEADGVNVYDRAWGLEEHGGKLTGGTFGNHSVPGRFGNAIDLGDDERGIVMNNVLNPIDHSLSISFWFKLTELITGDKILFDTGHRGGAMNKQGIAVILSDTNISFSAKPEGIVNYGYLRKKGFITWQTNQWYHAVAVIDRETNELRAYFDGVEATASDSDSETQFASEDIFVGYPGDLNVRFGTTIGMRAGEKIGEVLFVTDAIVDDFRMYTKALSSSEVSSIYNEPMTTSSNGDCSEGIYESGLLNASFESPKMSSPQISREFFGDWISSDSENQIYWSGAASNIPSAPNGENWAYLKNNNAAIFQQIGMYSGPIEMDVNFVYGKFTDESAANIRVSLWEGGDSYPESDSHLSDINATMIASTSIDKNVLNASGTSTETVSFSVTGNKPCSPLWILFENTENGRSLIDAIEVVNNDPVLVVDNNSLSITQNIYPNPSDGIFTIDANQAVHGLAVYDILGKRIDFKNSFLSPSKVVVHLSDKTPGVYFVKYNNRTSKLIVK